MVKLWWLRVLLVCTGIASLVLGVVGIVIPLLPTTPFLLLSTACFIRSSDRLYFWLISQPWLGSYIQNYREHCAMTRRAKLLVLCLLWIVIGYSLFFKTSELWLQVILVSVATGVSMHVLFLKTVPADKSVVHKTTHKGIIHRP